VTDDLDDTRVDVLLARADPDEMARAAAHLLREAHLQATDRGQPPPPDAQQLAMQALAGGLSLMAALAETGHQEQIRRVIGELDVPALRMAACQAVWELGQAGWRPAWAKDDDV
jgi:hypothetical protein